MKKKLVLTATVIAGIAGVAITWPQPVVRLLRIVFPNVIWEMRTHEPLIALTFDDGPDPAYTPQVLDVLQRYEVTATFFLVGERVRRFPEIFRQIQANGHGVGNHSDSWRRTIQLSDDEFERDLLRAEQAIGKQAIGMCTSPKLFRPAGGMIRTSQQRVLQKHSYSLVLGGAFAFDPYRPPTQFIEWAITRGLKSGAIVVLHDSGGDRSNTVRALPAIIRNAKAAGLRFANLAACIHPT
jgi:peptidoglycan/xylan/chitin deacetylase (PgdA/CDA1 family)